MAQVPSFTIPNGTGAEVRAGFNAVLAALKSANSGASEPSAPVAGMLWLDTTAGTLKIRNAANTSWVALLSFIGALSAESGLRVDSAQSLSSVAKTQGRDNLGLGALATKAKAAVGDITATGTAASGTFLRGDGAWAGVLGIGQGVQQLLSSRVAGVTYQNTTGAPIWVYLEMNADGATPRPLQISANGVDWVQFGRSSNSGIENNSMMVPPGYYYRLVSGGAFFQWNEVR